MRTLEKAGWKWYPEWLLLALTAVICGTIAWWYQRGPAVPGLEIPNYTWPVVIACIVILMVTTIVFADPEPPPRSPVDWIAMSFLGWLPLVLLLFSSNTTTRNNLMDLSQQQYSYKLQTRSDTYRLTLSPIQAACAQKEGIITPDQLERASRSIINKTSSMSVEVMANDRRGGAALQRAWKDVQATDCTPMWIGEGDQRLLIGQRSAVASEVDKLLSLNR